MKKNQQQYKQRTFHCEQMNEIENPYLIFELLAFRVSAILFSVSWRKSYEQIRCIFDCTIRTDINLRNAISIHLSLLVIFVCSTQQRNIIGSRCLCAAIRLNMATARARIHHAQNTHETRSIKLNFNPIMNYGFHLRLCLC